MKLFNECLVKVDSPFRTTIKGFQLDPTYQKEKHVRTSGIVKYAPAAIRKGEAGSILCQKSYTKSHLNIPNNVKEEDLDGVEDTSVMEYYYMSDISPEVQVGDKIYWIWTAGMNVVQKNRYIEIDGETLWRIGYDSIICAVRDGKIIPVGSYVLCKPDMETWEDITVKIPYYSKITNRMEVAGIVTKTAPQAKYLKAYVHHIGTPLAGQELELSVGDHIIYRKYADMKVEIEGEEYYAMRYSHIEAKIEK